MVVERNFSGNRIDGEIRIFLICRQAEKERGGQRHRELEKYK